MVEPGLLRVGDVVEGGVVVVGVVVVGVDVVGVADDFVAEEEDTTLSGEIV